MLRITTHHANGCGARIKVEGRIAGRQSAELLRAVRGVTGGARSVVLDMSGVTFVDRDGLELLRLLRSEGAAFDACSTFVSVLMHGDFDDRADC